MFYSRKARLVEQSKRNIIHHIARVQRKNPIIVSKDTEKGLDKIQHLFMILKQTKLLANQA